MANSEYLSRLKRSVADWNQWRKDNTVIRPYLCEADLRGANLTEADLSQADLRGADLSRADFRWANLRGASLFGANLREADLHDTDLRRAYVNRADLRGANLTEADLSQADLHGADLRKAILVRATLHGADLREAKLHGASLVEAKLHGADLRETNLTETNLGGADLSQTNLTQANLLFANLTEANLTGADLAGATLERSILVNTTCNRAIFTGCRIHGISAWDLQLEEAQQSNLIITPLGESNITVDNLEVAQFIYLLLNNQRIRHVIDTITSKVVLILGRFTSERKVVLDAIRDQLRRQDYLPVLFDFEKPRGQTTLDTINTLASMARFVIADITDAKSVLQELTMIVPHRPLLPIQPVLLSSQEEPGMFDFFRAYPWFLKTLLYCEQKELLESLQVKVILPAEQKAKELIAMQRK